MNTNKYILLLNCIGSYFYHLVNYITENNEGYLVLYYLATGKLMYHKLNLTNVKEKYKDNPWGYQPIGIWNEDLTPLLIDAKFFSFMQSKLNICVEQFETKEKEELRNRLLIAQDNGFYTIVSVDEFYLAESRRFFEKKHNKHFLLLRKSNLKDKTVEVIDSEKNIPYSIHYNELEDAVCKSIFSKKMIYQIDCTNYRNKIKVDELWETWKALQINCNYIEGLKLDMLEVLPRCEKNEYYFQGYYYTILSKIYPYSFMLYNLLSECDVRLSSDAFVIAQLWKNMSNFMLYKIRKGESGIKGLIEKIDEILKQQERLDVKLKV